ncbi:MAG: 16S rRNA (cytosine(1402)-N(4))-methyltransferase RsmH [Patescibacteria group bacterium]
MEFKHQPVLLKEVLDYLPSKTGIFVDGTLGGGGHTKTLLEKSQMKVIGIDQDLEAIFAAKKNLGVFADRIEFVHDNFSNLPEILQSKKINKVDAILLDLGVSSYQLDNKARGFSFQEDAPLDMRMNQSAKESAAEIINNYPEEDLAGIFYDYGEERNSRKIAKNIVLTRKERKIETTNQLVKIVESSFPANYKNKYKIHPATRVFQALRIETNNELNILKEFIPTAAEFLAGDGRLLIISFHSLEDRIVKHAFRDLEEKYSDQYKHQIFSSEGAFNALSSPSAKLSESCYKVLTKKPIEAEGEEIRQNPRSRSAKLRVLKKLI